MKEIKISGTICGAEYDDEWFAQYIERGIITPSSRVVNALESATHDEPVTIFVNSFGGDVFAGAEIVIAARKCRTRGVDVSVEIGAKAFSMGANLVAAMKASGAKVTAHSNSQIMFHSCATSVDGGPQRLEDEATALRGVNDAVVADLNKLGITDCRAWFAEGRERWMSAQEALDYHLIDGIEENDAEDTAEPKEIATRMAAFARLFIAKKEPTMETQTPVVAVVEETHEEVAVDPAVEPQTTEHVEPVAETHEATPAETVAPTADPSAEADIEARVTALANERFSRLQSKHDQMISDLKDTNTMLKAELEKAQAESTTLAESNAKLTADLATVRDQLEAEKKAHEAVVAAALKPQPKTYGRATIAAAMKIK